jgi:hypothetical protein
MMRVTSIRAVDHSLRIYTLRDFLKLFEPIRSPEISTNNTIAIMLTDTMIAGQCYQLLSKVG